MSTKKFRVWATRNNYIGYYEVYVMDMDTRIVQKVRTEMSKRKVLAAAKEEMRKRASV